MKIYFEDGKLDNPPFCDYHVDAAEGVMANIYWLDAIKEKKYRIQLFIPIQFSPLTIHMLGIMNLIDLKFI